MHRYPAAAGGSSSGVPGGGGPPPARSSDPSFQNSSNFNFASRRTPPLQPYKLRCEREPLSGRLGAPDFYPPTPNCAEEILNRDTCQVGYKELIEDIDEPKEALLTLTNNNTLWARPNVNHYRESIRKRLRELNNALIRKRKAGQVYGVPLSGTLLAKTGVFPEHRTCGEDFRKKWIEDLSQRKRLRSLAEHVPHGYQRRTIFEALIRHDVPLLRATWFIKIIYLNQVKPMSIGMSAGGPDKSQSKRVELWTKNVLDYTQWLLDDLCQPGGSSGAQTRVLSTSGDSEPDVLTKWRYVVRLAHWHYTEGLLNRTQIVDWALKQLQEKDSVEALELLLPVVLELIDDISLSQTHARLIIEICLQWLRKLCPSGNVPSPEDNFRHNQVAETLVKLLHYLLVVIPDTFVALDCFPLPHSVSSGANESSTIESASHDIGRELRVNTVDEDRLTANAKGKRKLNSEVVVDESVDLIRRRIASLSRAVTPTLLRNNEGKIVQALDKALEKGDVAVAYRSVYDEEFCSSDNLPADWRADVTSRTAFNLSGPVDPSELYPVRFLCEWAVCDFRDSRGSSSKSARKHCACRDMSRVYVAVSVLRMRIGEMDSKMSPHSPDTRSADGGVSVSRGGVPVQVRSRKGRKGASQVPMDHSAKKSDGDLSAAHDSSPIAMHDLIYAWLDQHELWLGDRSERLPLLLSELVREGLFSPEAYVRQLLCNGVLDKQSTAAEVARASRHRYVLQQLPSPGELIGIDDKDTEQSEAFRIYRIERRLALDGLGIRRLKQQSQETAAPGLAVQRGSDLRPPVHEFGERKKSQKRKLKIPELKQLIATSLQLPEASFSSKQFEEKTGVGTSGSKRLISWETKDATPGCEQCSRAKRQKANEGKEWIATGSIISLVEEDECWWAKKGLPKVVENTVKLEPPVKSAPKQTTRGRQKPMRKTQSLAQMAITRNDSNQGASNTHVLEPKVSCPIHHSSLESGVSAQPKDNKHPKVTGDLRALGEAMKRLRVAENRMLVSWLDSQVRSLLSSEGSSFPNIQANRGLANGGVLDADSGTWRLAEEQFAIIVYIMDVGNDLRTLVQLLLWLLPISGISSSVPFSHVNPGIPAYAGSSDGSPCAVSETALLSCLQRYESVITAMDMLPQALSAVMQRAANVMAAVPGGRAGCSALLCYVRDLLKKYGSLASVQAWEKNCKASCDQRLRAELEALKAGDSEGGFGLVSSMGEDRDDPIAPRLTGRLGRVGNTMKDTVQRTVDRATQIIINNEREGGGDCMDEVFQIGHTLVGTIMNTIRQNSGGASQADAALVAHAVSQFVYFAGQSVAHILESLGYSTTGESASASISAEKGGRRMLQFHIYCLQLLKGAIDDRQIRMLEVAVANESNTIVQTGIGHLPGRAPRSQFHLSPETPESNSTLTSDPGGTFGRPNMAAAAALALVAGLVVNGVTSLERMVSLLRVKDVLENLHLQKPGGPISNGKVSGMGVNAKAESVPEAHINWFRVLIGDSRTVLGGLVADLLGEPAVLGLARLQRSMALVTVFPPAYALFAVALRRQQSSLVNNMNREEAIFQAVNAAVKDMVAHEPFRDVCLRDTTALYRCLSGDSGESKYAGMLDGQGCDLYKKVSAMVPLRARLFLHALLDRKMPEDDMRVQNRSHSSNGPGQMEQVVQVLDELQAATFHWQWVELRLLLNEQVILEKLKIHPQSAQEAVQAAMQGPDRQQLDECEKTFTEVVLTRLLVRPDAAALYSEVVHLLGKALEDYLILHVKWVLENNDMLLGRKSLRQLLDNIAAKGFPVGIRHVRSWDWQAPKQAQRVASSEISERKQASSVQGREASPEEGELEDEAMDWQSKAEEKSSRQGSAGGGLSGGASSKPFATEKALADLVLPCLARSSMDTRGGFAYELVKEMNNLEQHISNLTRNSGRTTASTAPGGDGILGSKGPSSRRGPRGGMDVGSPGLGRRFPAPVPEAVPVSPAALQTSIWLRLQFLLPLLPIILSERDQQSVPNKRQTLAPVLLRLLGTRVVQEDADQLCSWDQLSTSSTDYERNLQATSAAAAASAGEPLFDRLLSILHALLSNTWAVWLKPRNKGSGKPVRDISPFDKEAAERMQADVEHMQLPCGIRNRLQAAFPLLPPTPVTTISAAPPQVPAAVVSQLQARPAYNPAAQKSLYPLESKSKAAVVVAPDAAEMEVDPWTLLEDGVGASTGPSGGGEVGNLKACAWLKGAVRIRRTDLTYIGAVDEEP